MDEFYVTEMPGFHLPGLIAYLITNNTPNRMPDLTPDSIICFHKNNAEALCEILNEHNNPKPEYESTIELKEALHCLRVNKGNLDDDIVETLIGKIYEKPREKVKKC